MIKGIIVVNNHGKPRLVKFYQSVVSVAFLFLLLLRILSLLWIGMSVSLDRYVLANVITSIYE